MPAGVVLPDDARAGVQQRRGEVQGDDELFPAPSARRSVQRREQRGKLKRGQRAGAQLREQRVDRSGVHALAVSHHDVRRLDAGGQPRGPPGHRPGLVRDRVERNVFNRRGRFEVGLRRLRVIASLGRRAHRVDVGVKRGVPRCERTGRLCIVGRRRRNGRNGRRGGDRRRPRLCLLRGDLGGTIRHRVRLRLRLRLLHGREPPLRGFIETRRAEYALGSPAEPTERAEFDDFLDRFRLRHLLARALQQQVVVGDVGEVVDETRRVVVRRVPERPLHVIHRPFVHVGSVVLGERSAGRRRADGGASRVSR